LVLFLTTISLIDASIYLILLITCLTTLGYSLLLSAYHRAEEVLVRCYAIYKYEFVRVFDEVIEGATLIRIFGRNEAVLNKAKEGFIRVAAYKQAVNSARLVQDLLCELCSTIVIGLGLEYGTVLKVKEGEQNEALVAVTVLLLLNLSEVFRNIISSVIKLESFFRLSLLSFI
jgi:ABC-type transport system involved in cytochrome bd biosynthesis fused ATPase/permease subunit